MPLPCAGYQPREAERGVLYRVVGAHLDAFLDAAAHHAEGARLPAFVEREFRGFLTCGVLAHGFARLRCGECAFERLVPFCCKGRGFCPSCGGRRMTESAARLVDHVLPHVPVRQWVLSLPYRLRYVVAWNHDLCRAVLAVYVRALLAFQRRRARRCRGRGRQSGCVTVIQRFGGGLNLNVHFHTLVLDGVFTEGPGDMLRFQPTPPPTDEEVGLVLATIATRVRRLLRRRGLDAEADVAPPDLLAEESAALAGISSASVQGRIALGRRAGGRVWRLGEEPDAPWIVSNTPRHAQLDGFDLHANVAVPASDRARLEQLCRYLLRPAVSQDRLQLLGDGRVLLALKTAWADGTRHLLFEPLELLEKLAALTRAPGSISCSTMECWPPMRAGAPAWWPMAPSPPRPCRLGVRTRTMPPRSRRPAIGRGPSSCIARSRSTSSPARDVVDACACLPPLRTPERSRRSCPPSPSHPSLWIVRPPPSQSVDADPTAAVCA